MIVPGARRLLRLLHMRAAPNLLRPVHFCFGGLPTPVSVQSCLPHYVHDDDIIPYLRVDNPEPTRGSESIKLVVLRDRRDVAAGCRARDKMIPVRKDTAESLLLRVVQGI